MNWSLFGLVDVIIVLGALISLIIGFKKGFINKVLSLVGLLAILVFAVFAASAFAGFLENHDIIFPSLQTKFENNIVSNAGGATTAEEALVAALNVRPKLAEKILNVLNVDATTNFAKEISYAAARFVMKFIAFGILFVGGLVLLLILKIVAKFIRTNTFIRIVDGILGVLLYAAIYAVIVAGLFTLLYLITEQWGWLPDSAADWIHTDFKVVVQETSSGIVVTNTKTTLSGIIYKSNPFMTILRFFGLK